jgi:hypothetical protein
MSGLTRKSLLFAASVMPSNAPLAERLRILEVYLDPKPGAMITIDQQQLRDQGPVAKDPGKLFGTIRITPPKGTCFTITVDKSRPDQEICQPTSVKWRLEDLDRETGTITWHIKTGSMDFGTPVRWTAPYVIARTMPPDSEFYHYNSTPIFFKSCVPQKANAEGRLRQIVLTKFDNTNWIIRFPEKDVPIPPPEPPLPVVEEPKKKKSGAQGDAEDHGEKKEADGPGDKPAVARGMIKIEDIVDNREQWTINTGRGYEMNVGNFISDGSMPPGKRGTCRYVYDYLPGDFSMGRLECHHTDQYLYVYMFLPCMGPIIPK